MTPTAWAVLYLVAGAAYLGACWHRRAEQLATGAILDAEAQGVPRAAAVSTVGLAVVAVVLPLWPLYAASGLAHRARRRRGAR